jgi:DNA-directed RNA polymerase subunit N
VLVPVRCFTCGALLADKYYEFSRRVAAGEDPGAVLDDLGVKRYCCRRTLLSAVEPVDMVMEYYVARKRFKVERAEQRKGLIGVRSAAPRA